MSTGYDIPPPPSTRSPFESRKSSGSMTASYERNSTISNRRTPSPGPSRRAYDSYVPHRVENVPYRNVYRPNIYRPDPSSYHPRSPSPVADSPSYRGSSWRPPDRRLLPSSPTLRRFEPSDSWRHGHGDRSGRDFSSHSDRHFRGRAGVDLSPERSPRYERTSNGVQDRYGPPHLKRETWPPERRPVMDSYRPHYDDERPLLTRRDHPPSPSNGHARRESESSLQSRLTDPDFTRAPVKPSLSVAVPESPAPVTSSPTDPPWASPLSLDAVKRISVPRSTSRSSIASTQVSDRRSPGVASIPQPLSLRLAVGLPAKPQAAIDALAKENRRADAKYGVKPVHNSVISQTPMHAIEPEKDLKTPSSAVREPANDISQTVIAASQAQEHPDVEEPSATMPAVVDVDTQTDIDDQEPGVELSSPKPPTPVHEPLRSPILTDAPSSNIVADIVVVESDHSEHGPPLERIPSNENEDVPPFEIPPSTHSPSGLPDPSDEMDTGEADLLAHTTLPRPEDIPVLSSARNMREAFRIIVMTRLLRDHQSREARINPVLMANLAIAPPLEVHPSSTPGSLIDKMCSGLAHDTRLEAASKTRPLLVKYFANRQSIIDEKKTRLREEYGMLQDRWIAHCNALNEQHRTLASEQENQPPVRTTRRSMAITDAVRSDFEMEQIIASLGNDDATDPNHLSIRNLARIPEMISAINGKVDTVFDDMNYLVENPAEYYAPDTGINDWTDEEKKVFMEKFGAHPKQFGVIAEFLPNKTAAQCVAYYYLHKKLFIDFRRVISQYAPNKRRRRGMGRKKGNGLLADIAMHDLEVHRGSGPSILMGTARPRGRRSLNAISAVKPSLSSRRNLVQLEETSTSTPTPEPESKSRKRRGPSGASTPVPSNPSQISLPLLASTPLRMSTPFTEQYFPPLQTNALEAPATVEEEDVPEQWARPVKRARRTRKIKSAVIVADEPISPPLQTVLLPADDIPESVSHGSGRVGPSTVQWSDDDKKRFRSLFSQYGTDFKQIAALMPPKTIGQVNNYYKTHQASFSPDDHEPHWSTFPLSETKQKISTPPVSSPATLMTTIKPPSTSSLGGYDSSRNLYPTLPTSSLIPFTIHANAPGDIQSPPWGAPLSTKAQPLMHSGSLDVSGTRNALRRPPHSLPSSESSQGYANSTGKYHEEHPRLLPNPHLASPPNLPLRTPQDYHPRIATSHYSVSPSPHATSVPGLSSSASAVAASSLPGPTTGAATIVHSPILASPRPPLHRSPPPYNSYPPPLPHGSDPTSGVEQYRQPEHRHYQSHSRQHSGSSMTGWPHPNSPRAQDRHYRQPANVSYDDRKSGPIPSVNSSEPRRETYPDFPPSFHDHPGHGWRPSSTNTSHPNSSPWTTDSYPKSAWRG